MHRVLGYSDNTFSRRDENATRQICGWLLIPQRPCPCVPWGGMMEEVIDSSHHLLWEGQSLPFPFWVTRVIILTFLAHRSYFCSSDDEAPQCDTCPLQHQRNCILSGTSHHLCFSAQPPTDWSTTAHVWIYPKIICGFLQIPINSNAHVMVRAWHLWRKIVTSKSENKGIHLFFLLWYI